jgi:hypothetical protein
MISNATTTSITTVLRTYITTRLVLAINAVLK